MLDETIAAGQAGHLTDHDTIAAMINDLSGAWTAYTPTWTASGTAPDIGDGTLAGAYKLIDKTLYVRIEFSAGSTTTFGTGSYAFFLPTGTAAGLQQPVTARAYDTSTGLSYVLGAYAVGTHIEAIVNGAGLVGAAAPMTWANGDTLFINGVIEVS